MNALVEFVLHCNLTVSFLLFLLLKISQISGQIDGGALIQNICTASEMNLAEQSGRIYCGDPNLGNILITDVACMAQGPEFKCLPVSDLRFSTESGFPLPCLHALELQCQH